LFVSNSDNDKYYLIGNQMNEEMRQELYRLKGETNCTKNYLCIFESGNDLCEARYHASADLLECIDEQKCSCEHSTEVSSIYICKCQLRKFLAINLEEISKHN
jgi:hypothetical protein